MGDLISLAELRASRAAPAAHPASRGGGRPRVTFYFDLASPWSYLAAAPGRGRSVARRHW